MNSKWPMGHRLIIPVVAGFVASDTSWVEGQRGLFWLNRLQTRSQNLDSRKLFWIQTSGSVIVLDVRWSHLGAGTLTRPLPARSGSGCCHHDSVGHWCICVTVCPLRPWVLGAVGSPPLSSLVTFASIVEEEKQQEAALIRSREKPLALIQVDVIT